MKAATFAENRWHVLLFSRSVCLFLRSLVYRNVSTLHKVQFCVPDRSRRSEPTTLPKAVPVRLSQVAGVDQQSTNGMHTGNNTTTGNNGK